MRPAFFILLALLGPLHLHAQATLRLEVATDREFYREDSTNQVFLQTRIVPELPAGTPPPGPTTRHIALVIDRSGSMAGAPLDALRPEITALAAQLSPTDTLALITFGSEVETLLPAQRVGELIDLPARLATLEAAGGSALFDALNQAAAQLRRHAQPTTINHLILLTDGPPTKGPRDTEDFAKLAGVLLRENITVSTFGLGPECNEDLLSTLAQKAAGTFRYLENPAQIPGALQAALPAAAALLATDIELKISFIHDCDELETHGWSPAFVSYPDVICRLPRLLAGQPVELFASAQLHPARFTRETATVYLTWHDKPGGALRSLQQRVPVEFTNKPSESAESRRPAVARNLARTIVSDGLQSAIELLDKANPRRALAALREIRGELKSLNYDLADPQIAATLAQLEGYIESVQSRPLNALDRKVLRSGLRGQFDPPPVAPKKP